MPAPGKVLVFADKCSQVALLASTPREPSVGALVPLSAPAPYSSIRGNRSRRPYLGAPPRDAPFIFAAEIAPFTAETAETASRQSRNQTGFGRLFLFDRIYRMTKIVANYVRHRIL